MESISSRKFLRNFEIKDNKIIKTFGTGEIREVEKTKANLINLKMIVEKQIEEYDREERFTKFNQIFFNIIIIFFGFSFITFFMYSIVAAMKTDFLSVILGGLICILSMTLFLVSKEYNKLNIIHRTYIDEATPFIEKLKEKIKSETKEGDMNE